MDFNFDFQEEINKQISQKYEDIYWYSKNLASKFDVEKPDWLAEEFIQKFLDFNGKILASVLEKYHTELMDYLNSK